MQTWLPSAWQLQAMGLAALILVLMTDDDAPLAERVQVPTWLMAWRAMVAERAQHAG